MAIFGVIKSENKMITFIQKERTNDQLLISVSPLINLGLKTLHKINVQPVNCPV